jgi:hypothetical protein
MGGISWGGDGFLEGLACNETEWKHECSDPNGDPETIRSASVVEVPKRVSALPQKGYEGEQVVLGRRLLDDATVDGQALAGGNGISQNPAGRKSEVSK